MSTTARHFGNIKRFKKASDQRYCSFLTLIFSILKAWICESSSVRKHSAQGYVTTCGPFFGHFDALKMPFCLVLVTWVQTFISFGILKMRLLKYPQTLDQEVSSIHNTVRSFGDLKWDSSRVMRMLVEKCMVSAENQILILAALKSDFWRIVTSTSWGNWLHDNHCSTFWQQGSWKPRNKGILLSFIYS